MSDGAVGHGSSMAAARRVDWALRRLMLGRGFDRLATPTLARLFFPASRLWAIAADLEHGSADDSTLAREALAAAAGRPARLVPRLLAARAVRSTQSAAADFAAVYRRWHEAFFPPPPGSTPTPELPLGPDGLTALALERHRAAHRFNAARGAFMPLLPLLRPPPVLADGHTPDTVLQLHGARLAGREPPFPAWDAAELSAIALSPSYRSADGSVHILRGPIRPTAPESTPLSRWVGAVEGADRLCARLVLPDGHRAGQPVVVFAHGVAMETEFWRGRSDPASELSPHGIATMLAEGPGHGHRRCRDSYGGEPVLGGGVEGMLRYFQRHVPELGALIAFARARFGGPVGLAGVSLGALTAQLAAVAARDWPEAMRPDALFLLTTSGSLTAVAFESDLTRALGVPQHLARQGWGPDALRRFLPLLEPQAPPALPPERIVMVLGARDGVTPYPGGAALAELWRVPAENLFLRPGGHFTTALETPLVPAPVLRFATLLRDLSPQ